MVNETYGKSFWTWETIITTWGVILTKAAIIDTTKVAAARLQGCVVEKLVWNLVWSGKSDGDGPVQLGFAASTNLNEGEIAGAMNASPQVDDEDGMVGVRRNLKATTHMIAATGTDSTSLIDDRSRFRTMKFPSWKIRQGVGMNIFFFNHSAASITTGVVSTLVLGIKQKWLGA